MYVKNLFDCGCMCHTMSGVRHCVPCCDKPNYDDVHFIAEAELDQQSPAKGQALGSSPKSDTGL